ncbi:hypothetical protein [uncultured Prevotella sp.]|uniref:hypothetical protein n=1 Tax=uncultured Prevotella sp. TaxID=159272 RepID=UPI00260F30C2|nr:hypothetical protein [uncultured Prevotella sp.]
MKEMYEVICNQTFKTDWQAGKGRRAWCVLKFITDRQCGVVSPANVDIIPGGRLVDVIGWMMTDFAVSLNKNTNN